MDMGSFEFTPAFRATAQVSVTPKEGFSLGQALESVYPLLGLVFDYLGYKDLKRVSLVNSRWKTEAEKEMKKRINVAGWLTVYRETEEKSGERSCVDASTNFGFQRVQYIISFNDAKLCMMDHDFASQLDADVGCCEIYSLNLYSVYPKNYINLKSKMTFADVCLFPIIPNIRVATVCIPPTDFTKDVFNKSPNEKIRCLLVFKDCSSGDLTAEQIYQGVLMRKNYLDCAFGGCVTPSNIEYRNETDKQYMETEYLCIGFIENTDGENNNFDAASCVIGEEVDLVLDSDGEYEFASNHYGYEFKQTLNQYDDEFEQTLIQFKRKITIREHSLAFRFSRFSNAQEAVIFSKVFPDTLQYSCRASCPIGSNTIHSSEDSTALSQTKIRCCQVDCVECANCSIVFLTWGRIITQ